MAVEAKLVQNFLDSQSVRSTIRAVDPVGLGSRNTLRSTLGDWRPGRPFNGGQIHGAEGKRKG